MFSTKVLTSLHLKRLKEHRYSVTGSSLFEPILQFFWNWLITKTPLWIAPNLLTLVGVIVNIVTTLILVGFDPGAHGEGPRWTYLLVALGLFFYQALDAIDGKQARRTGSATPLGELFDHGCDAVSALMLGISCGSPAYLGDKPMVFAFIVFSIMTLYYLSHWQAYVCGKLTFRLLDVTEAQCLIMAIHVVTFLFGREFWETKVFGLTFHTIILVSVVVILLITFLLGVVNIVTGGVGKNGSTVADTSVLSPGIPLAIIFYFSWSFIKRSDTTIHEWPSLTLFVLGLPIIKLSWQIVISHMTKMPMPLFDSILLGPFALWINNHTLRWISDQEKVMLIIVMVYMLANTIVYGVLVCKQSCEFLGISCFTIPYPPPNKTATTTTTAKTTDSTTTTTTTTVAEESSDEAPADVNKDL